MSQYIPEVGSEWVHKNGTEYEVIAVANLKAHKSNYPVTIVYKGVVSGNVWSRTLDNWHESMSPKNVNLNAHPVTTEAANQVKAKFKDQLQNLKNGKSMFWTFSETQITKVLDRFVVFTLFEGDLIYDQTYSEDNIDMIVENFKGW